jgi:predicted DNA-binding protein (UPF0251 family)
MTTVQFDLPDDLVTLPEHTPERLRDLAREALIVRLLDQEVLTASWAAHVLGLSQRALLDLLASYRVSVFDETMDVQAEAQHG